MILPQGITEDELREIHVRREAELEAEQIEAADREARMARLAARVQVIARVDNAATQ